MSGARWKRVVGSSVSGSGMLRVSGLGMLGVSGLGMLRGLWLGVWSFRLPNSCKV